MHFGSLSSRNNVSFIVDRQHSFARTIQVVEQLITNLYSDDAAARHVSDHVVLSHRLKVGLYKHQTELIDSSQREKIKNTNKGIRKRKAQR